MVESLDFNLLFIILEVSFLVGTISFIIYSCFCTTLSQKEVKKKLKLVIKVMGSTLVESLNENLKFNSLLKKYLTTNSEDILNEVAQYICITCPVSKHARITIPATVLISLMKVILKEQLDVIYSNGYFIPNKTIDDVINQSPFAKNYCFCIQKNDGVFIDFLYCNIEMNLSSCINFSLIQFFNLIKTEEYVDYDKLYVPPIIVGLLKTYFTKYYYVITKASYVSGITPKRQPIYLKGLIARSGFFNSSHKAFGGDFISETEDIEIARYCNFASNDSYSVIVFRKERSN